MTVASIPLALFARFPALAHVVGVGIEEALDLQGLRLAIQHDAVMARASIQPATLSSVHAMGDVGDGRAEFLLVKRQRRQRCQGKRDRDRDGASVHVDTADPHQRERHLPP